MEGGKVMDNSHVAARGSIKGAPGGAGTIKFFVDAQSFQHERHFYDNFVARDFVPGNTHAVLASASTLSYVLLALPAGVLFLLQSHPEGQQPTLLSNCAHVH